jgi:hypothetical protein
LFRTQRQKVKLQISQKWLKMAKKGQKRSKMKKVEGGVFKAKQRSIL